MRPPDGYSHFEGLSILPLGLSEVKCHVANYVFLTMFDRFDIHLVLSENAEERVFGECAFSRAR